MKKSILTLVVIVFGITTSFAQHWSLEVQARNCEWTDFNAEKSVPSYDDGEKVVITASGSWISNGETFRYNGAQHYVTICIYTTV